MMGGMVPDIEEAMGPGPWVCGQAGIHCQGCARSQLAPVHQAAW